MAIKTTISTPKEKVKPYPKIMRSNMYVTLFRSAGTGTILDVVRDDAGWEIGDTPKGIPMACYTDYNEPITLQNK